MPFIDMKLQPVARVTPKAGRGKAGAAIFWAFATIGAAAAPASAATLSRSVDVPGSPEAVWSAIGDFCAIGEWHPAIASCRLGGERPLVRTLATRDNATFVERQTARDDARRYYSYTFLSSPLPVTNYSSTFKVTSKAPGLSTVVWSGRYAVAPADAEPAKAALAGIYESGLAAIKAKLAR